MKPYFDKIVTEKPRAQGGHKYPKGEKRRWDRCDEEDYPKSEKIRNKWIVANLEKQFTDVLGPINRYLYSKVGCNWDEVYAEISERLPKTTLQNIHIWTHIWQFVAKKVVMIAGVPCNGDGYGYGRPLDNGRFYGNFYIHPETNLLCALETQPKKKWTTKPPSGIILDATHQIHKIKGIWYEVEVKKCNVTSFASIYDVVLCKSVLPKYAWYELRDLYGKDLYGVSKRQLNKKEIRKLNLKAA